MACVSMKTMQQARRPKCLRHVIGQTGTFMSSKTTTVPISDPPIVPQNAELPGAARTNKKTGTDGAGGFRCPAESGGIQRSVQTLNLYQH
jgi:hypothetical protein